MFTVRVLMDSQLPQGFQQMKKSSKTIFRPVPMDKMEFLCPMMLWVF